MASKDFISHAEWAKIEKYDGTDQILKWSDVPQDTIFFLETIEERKDPRFHSYVLHFYDRNDLSYQAYAPSHFIKEIRKRRAINAQPYFVSLGTVEYNNKQIAKFNISYKVMNKEWDIFQ